MKLNFFRVFHVGRRVANQNAVGRDFFRCLSVLCILTLSLGACGNAEVEQDSASWTPLDPLLATPWTAQVSADEVLPEYPRPMMVRSKWLNLNGVWQFAEAQDEIVPTGQDLSERILVPFPTEATLSGVGRQVKRMWYRRSFEVPSAWSGQRVQLHFGAVDYEATVYVNGEEVGSHRGGYDGFSFDITEQLKDGPNELIVGVYDPTDAGAQAVGKQRLEPGGIMYTPTSGIWQTVWLEPTPTTHITRVDTTPKLAEEVLEVNVQVAGAAGQTVWVEAFRDGQSVGTLRGQVGTPLRLPIPNPRLWQPDDPFLYNLKVTLEESGNLIDEVSSYFGMREVMLGEVDGTLRPMLNGEFLFQMGTLDQGYWPDGIYTAPTDEALRFDLEQHKAMGFNMVRKHVKVEPQRWYYWADKLGLLVWQDMPSMPEKLEPSPDVKTQFERELSELVHEHLSHPSLVMWVVLNEGWGQYDQARLADLVKRWDPSRLVNNMSGVNCCGSVDGGNGDVIDWHNYPEPVTSAPSETRAAVLGEYGGVSLALDAHSWPGASNVCCYGGVDTQAALTERYLSLLSEVQALVPQGLSAAVYTQITDVERELNGLMTYDRKVTKVDAAKLKEAHEQFVSGTP